MLLRALPMAFLVAFPALVAGQTAPTPSQVVVPGKPQPASESTIARPETAPQDKLQQLIASRDAISKEILRLRAAASQQQQVIVSVQFCELSLTKARLAKVTGKGVETRWLQSGGFGDALAAGVFDHPKRAQSDSTLAESEQRMIDFRVLENERTLNTVVAALKDAGALKVLAEPTLMTVSGRTASLHKGGKFPVPIPRSKSASAIEYLEFGTQIDILPVVLGNQKIRLELRSRIRELDLDLSVVVGGLKVPGFRAYEINTAIEMQSGQTCVMGGLMRRRVVREARGADAPTGTDTNKRPNPEKNNNSQANPSRDQNETEETELIVIVRPEIIEAPKVARRVRRE